MAQAGAEGEGMRPPSTATQAAPHAADERSLLLDVQAGDAKAFEILFQRYGGRVYRQAMHLLNNEAEAQEIVQDVFLAVYDKAKTFRGESAFTTWLYRLTANAALGKLRYRKRHPEVAIEDYLPSFQEDGHHRVRPVVDWSDDPANRVSSAELQQLVRQAIEALPPLDRMIVVLSDLEEFSDREISDIVELSVSAVKARLHRARLFLRGQLTVALGHSPA